MRHPVSISSPRFPLEKRIVHASTRFFFCALLAAGACTALATDGALDATFAAGGKSTLAPSNVNQSLTSLAATDTAIQSDDKIVITGNDNANDCFLARFNGDGSLDTGFYGGNGFPGGLTGYGACTYNGVAIRPDGRLVAVGNFEGATFGIVSQFSAGGAPDSAFGTTSGGTNIVPDSPNDRIYLARVVIEADGSIDVAGTYYQQNFNGNQFFFARISADGKTVEPFRYQFGTGANQDDHASDLAIDGQGRYVVVGYHRGANGNYDFAAIRIRNDLYDVDNTFGNAGQTTVDFGDDGDYCNTLAITGTGHIALGGQSSGQAALALLDPSGKLDQYFSSGLLYPAKFSFVYGSGGGNDTITRLVLDDYDTRNPQLLAIGSGFQPSASGAPYGIMFGIARLDLPMTYSNFTRDTGFGGTGTEGVYFADRPDGLGLLTTTNHGLSAAFARGKLVAAGYTAVPGGTEIAVTRLAAFDGIFRNGLEVPNY